MPKLNELEIREKVCLQQDGAPVHYTACSWTSSATESVRN